MTGATFVADDLSSPVATPVDCADGDMGNAAADFSSAEEEAFAPDQVSSNGSDTDDDSEGQLDQDDADVAFVGDLLPEGEEENDEGSDAAPVSETLDSGAEPAATGDDPWQWTEVGLPVTDGFTFHPDSSEQRQASEPEPEVSENLEAFFWVCEFEPAEWEFDAEAAQDASGDEPSFVAPDSGDTLL